MKMQSIDCLEAYERVLGFKLSSHSCKTGSFHGSQRNMVGVCVTVPFFPRFL